MLKDQTAIVGIGETEFAKQLPDTEWGLACTAIKAALDDAGIHPSEVDAMGCFNQEVTPEFEIARSLGFGDVHFFNQVAHGGGAACGVLGQVAMAVASGVANVGIVWRSRKRGDPGKRQWAGVQPRVRDHWKWSRPQGVLRPVDEVAMTMRRYMHEYSISRQQLAAVALSQRAYANTNPRAIMRDKPMQLDDYMHARMISDPLCLFDNCLESDGAVALVITRAADVDRQKQKPVYIHAFSQGMSSQHQLMTDYHGADPLRSSSWTTAKNLWRQSDIQPDEINLAQFYDAFSPMILYCLEAYGFCARGEAAHFIADGGMSQHGQLPINTSGGSLSEVYLHGMNLLTEAVRQLRGQAANQVKAAESCLVATCDSTPNGALVLRR